MLENRSFDHMLGALQASIPDLDGVRAGSPRTNRDVLGRAIPQLPIATDIVDPDPKHGKANVLAQIDHDNGGFVQDFQRAYPDWTEDQVQSVMAYHNEDSLSAHHRLARSFAVCDKWFSSVPGPTWTNRLFAMSGTSMGRVKMPEGVFHPNVHKYSQPSVFRRLNEARRSYRIYYGDFPLALLLQDCRTFSARKHFSPLTDFTVDAAGDESQFPDFVFIEPRYLLGANDDHPPHPISAGESLLGQVYQAILANTPLWESTLLVVGFDEHGGFYDHVVPPAATPPDGHAEEYTFDNYGVRVPTLFISPWIEPQVIHTECDHTALLKSLQVKWNLGGMGQRVAGAADILSDIRLAAAPRTDLPRRLAMKVPAAAIRKSATLQAEYTNDNQRAIVAFSAYLETQTPQPPEQKVRSAARVLASPKSAMAVAEERAKRYLARKSRATRARKARNAASGGKPGRTR
jgi:phospholipase C